MNLTIDIGNTRTKAALFEGQKLERVFYDILPQQLADYKIDNVIVSSVAQAEGLRWKEAFGSEHYLHFSQQTPVPFRNHYATPHTLGLDRIAAVVGAMVLFPQKNCLVIDAGTCITFDLVEAAADYRGGAISAGLRMRAKALHTFTARLPLVENLSPTPLIGTSTQEAILSGIVNGAVAELEGIIGRYEQQYTDLQVLICGGDAAFFESQLKKTIFVVSDLVHIGLNRILEYNNEL